MAFSTGNPQFDFLMSRARNRKRSREALQENNIDVETSLEKREGESESSDVTSIGTQVTDISGLEASGISATDVSVSAGSQSIADAQEMMDIAGVGRGQTVGQVAFDTEMDRAKADFAQSNPVGAAIAGFSTDAVAQGVVQTAPLGLAMAGKMEAARAAANIANVVSGPAFGLISGVIGPTAQDPYGQNVAMGSGLLGQVSQSLMSTHYSVADKVAQGVPGYAQGYYGYDLVSLHPGFAGLNVATTAAIDYQMGMPLANAPYSLQKNVFKNPTPSYTGPPNAMTQFGRFGLDPNTVATYGSITDFGTAMNASKNTGYYGTVAQAVIDAKAGNKKAQSFLTEIEDTKGIETTGDLGGIGDLGSGYGIGTSTGTGSQTIGGQDVDPSQGGTTTGSAVGSTGGLGGPTGVGGGYGSPNDGEGADSGSGGAGDSSEHGGTRYGGRIGMAAGDVAQNPSTEMGFIGGPPDQFTEQQTIADDIPKEVPEGTFVINAPAVEFAGKEDIKQMLIEAYEIVAQADTDAGTDRTAQAAKVPSKEQVEIMISRGEVVVPPEIAKVIGYDRLEKINNRGKREVARRQEESEQQQEQSPPRPAAEGGFMSTNNDIASADYSEGGIDATTAMLLRMTGHLKNIEQGLGEGFKYGEKSREGDTLRHILTSGYISEDGLFNSLMSDLFDRREQSENMSEEEKIDLNNNKFGRLLRQKYPDRVEFTKQARNVVDKLIKGETVEIDGVSPMMSVRAE